MSFKILYIANHAVLEYDELRIFTSLGYEIFSTGFYKDPAKPSSSYIRPPLLDAKVVESARDTWDKLALTPDNCLLSCEFTDLFDLVITVRRLSSSDELKCKIPIVCRMIGQSFPELEARMKAFRQSIKIVRYSPCERQIPCYAGEDAIIRFGKFADEFGPYTGADERVLSFYQSASRRLAYCNFDFYELATRPFPRALYGNGNPILSFIYPPVEYKDMLELYRSCFVYFSIGTYPASYTLNMIEAMLSGVPLVTLGRKAMSYTSAPYAREYADVYEVPEFFENCPYPCIANNVIEARQVIESFMGSQKSRQEMSKWISTKARQLFDAQSVSRLWSAFIQKVS